MSAERTPLLHIALACGLLGQGGALADEMPDMEFLEYLGSWEGSDEDWLMVNDADYVREDRLDDERSDPAPTGEESTESEDER